MTLAQITRMAALNMAISSNDHGAAVHRSAQNIYAHWNEISAAERRQEIGAMRTAIDQLSASLDVLAEAELAQAAA
jgi:hypothetical protein